MKNKNFKHTIFVFLILLFQALLVHAGSFHAKLSVELWNQACAQLNLEQSINPNDLKALKTEFMNKVFSSSQAVEDTFDICSPIQIIDFTVRVACNLSHELQQRNDDLNKQKALQAIIGLMHEAQKDIQMIQAIEPGEEIASGQYQMLQQEWQAFFQKHYQAFTNKQSVLALMDQSLTDETWATLANFLNQSATTDEKECRIRNLIDAVNKIIREESEEHNFPRIAKELQRANRKLQYWACQAERKLTKFTENQTAQMHQAGPSARQSSVARLLENVASEDQPFRGFRFLPEPGEPGFGVGTLPQELLPQGLKALPGSYDPNSSDYGNFQSEDEGIYVMIPAFMFRTGEHTSPSLFKKYGAHAIELQDLNKWLSNYSCEQLHQILRNLAKGKVMPDGWQLHRAFVNAGQVQTGFFIQKYLASMSKDRESVTSKQGQVPLSLTSYFPCHSSKRSNGCQGQLDDAYLLAEKTSKSTGVKHHVVSVFEYNVLQMLILAQAQGARSNQHCAWWSENPNDCCPKGCCINLHDDKALDLSWQPCQQDRKSKYPTKPLTGTCNKPAWDSHNGQENGLMGFKGGLWEAAIGVTTANHGFLDTLFVLKPEADIDRLARESAFGAADHLLRQGFKAVDLPYQGIVSLTGWISLFSNGDQVTPPRKFKFTRTFLPLL